MNPAPEPTLHDIEARCPGCGDVRIIQTYAPPDVTTMNRHCDSCNGFRPKPRERPASLPYKDS